MYTAQLIGDTKNIDLRRRMVNVEFTDGKSTINKEFQFKINETVEGMKKIVKQYLDELNFVPPTIDGDIADAPVDTPTPPTKAELDKQEFDANVAKLETIKRYVDLGILTGNEPAVVAFRNKVKADFKPAYIA